MDRTIRPRRLALTALALAAALLTAQTARGQMTYNDFEKRLPDKPLLVIYSGGLDAIDRLGGQTAATAIWKEEGLKDCFATPYARAKALLPQIPDVPPPVLQMGVPFVEGMAQTSWCLVVDSIHVDPEAFAAAPENQKPMLLAQGLRAALIVHTPQGSPIRGAVDSLVAMASMTMPPGMLQPNGPVTNLVGFPVPAAWAQQGDLFVLSVGQGVAGDVLKGGGGAGGDFVALRTRLTGKREPLGLVAVDIDRAMVLAKQLLGDEIEKGAFEQARQSWPRSFGYAVTAHGRGFRSVMAQRMPPDELRKTATLTMDDLRIVPKDARFMQAGAMDLGVVYDNMTQQVEQLFEGDEDGPESIEAVLKPVEDELGFSIRHDLIASLGDRGMVWIPRRSNLLLLPDPVMTWQVRNPAKMRQCLDATIEAIHKHVADELMPDIRLAFPTGNYNGVPFRAVQFKGIPLPIAPAWAVTDDRIVAAASIPTLKAALDGMKSGGESIVDNEDFRRSLTNVRQTSYTAISYSDTKASVDALYGLMPMLYNTLSSAVPMELGFDPTSMPPANRVTRHLFGSVKVSYWDGDTLIDEGFGPLGGDNSTMAGLVAVPVMAGMLMPALSNARESARRAASINNMKQIGMATIMHTADNDGMLPESPSELVEEGYIDKTGLDVFVSPLDPRDPTLREAADIEAKSSYIFNPNLLGKRLQDIDRAFETPLAMERPEHFKGAGANVLFVDGHVEVVPAHRLDDILEKMKPAE